MANIESVDRQLDIATNTPKFKRHSNLPLSKPQCTNYTSSDRGGGGGGGGGRNRIPRMGKIRIYRFDISIRKIWSAGFSEIPYLCDHMRRIEQVHEFLWSRVALYTIHIKILHTLAKSRHRC